jgi:hypothetical protein
MLLAIQCYVSRKDILNKKNVTFSLAKPSWNAEATSKSDELFINHYPTNVENRVSS